MTIKSITYIKHGIRIAPEWVCPSGVTHYHEGEVDTINKHKGDLFKTGLKEVCEDLGKNYEVNPFRIVENKRSKYIVDIVCAKCDM